MAACTSLAGGTTTDDVDEDIVLAGGFGGLKRLLDDVHQHRVSKIGINIPAVHYDLALAFTQVDTSDSGLAATDTMTKINNFLHFFLCHFSLLP
ncbi:hypothetical protein DSECCO2_589600 [anaerobic digester metagenome]